MNKNNNTLLNIPKSLDSEFSNGIMSTLKIIDTIHNVFQHMDFNNLSDENFVIDTISSILWNNDQEPNNIFYEILSDTKSITNKEVPSMIQNSVMMKLEDLYSKFKDYNDTLKVWINDQNNKSLIDQLVYTFKEINFIYEYNMHIFRPEHYEVVLLPIYTQLANLHLLLLRDGMIYGEKLNLYSQLEYDSQNEYYQYVLENTKKYISHCVNYYNNGLQDIKFSQKKSWVDVNKYCRYMTFYVKDMISIFPVYDVRIYNKPIKMQVLTRKVYSDPTNFILNNNMTIDEYDKKYMISPKLFSTLYGITFYTDTQKEKFLSGYINRYKSTDINSEDFEETRYGNFDNANKKQVIDFKDIGVLETKIFYNSINNTKPTSIKSINFTGTESDKKWIYEEMESNSNNIEFTRNIEGSSADLNDESYTHILSNMILADGGNEFHAMDRPHSYSFAWTYKGIDRTNYIEERNLEDTDDLITQIPLVKGSKITSSEKHSEISVIEGPGFTGGDVILSKVYQPPNETPSYYMKNEIIIPIEPNLISTHRDFNIRIYYASNHDIGIMRLVAGHNYITTDIEQTFPDGDYYPDLKYNYFKYSYFDEPLSIPKGGIDKISLQFYYDDGTFNDFPKFLIADKIELIPIN
ncbi:insecticidal delta-endotoxin Cry8Ea1 family protein [Clostridium sp. Marseille-Q2269]|uniref:insecticidal delta-endotoxin Cry8Ea1 family protein n=1 Tax=Clostridium sp. Marseille-Q2269 TaxID=2942205 RepID=UPI002073AB25|nr:insecticidal delta-endotoxin Cry8Ea1 family protein [Clostridium sp. Marseille-Q2269]